MSLRPRTVPPLLATSVAVALLLTGCGDDSLDVNTSESGGKQSQSNGKGASAAEDDGERELVVDVPDTAASGYTLTVDDLQLLLTYRLGRAELSEDVSVTSEGDKVIIREKDEAPADVLTDVRTTLTTEPSAGFRRVLVEKDNTVGPEEGFLVSASGSADLLKKTTAVSCADTLTKVRTIAKGQDVVCSQDLTSQLLVGEVVLAPDDIPTFEIGRWNSDATFTITSAAQEQWAPDVTYLFQNPAPDNELALVAGNEVVLFTEVAAPESVDKFTVSLETTGVSYDIIRDEIAVMLTGNTFTINDRAATEPPTVNSVPATPSCDLVDMTPVADPDFLASTTDNTLNAIRGDVAERRCAMPDDSDIITWLTEHPTYKIKGVGGSASDSTYVLTNGETLIDVAYINDGHYYSTSPTGGQPADPRYTSARELLDAVAG